MTSFHSWHLDALRLHSAKTTPHLSLPSHPGSIFLTFSRFLSVHLSSWHTVTFLMHRSLVTQWILIVQRWSELCSFLPPLLSTLSSTKVRDHRAGLWLSSWHLEARAARRSGALGSVSSTCRNTTFNSCWRTALSSCAPPGQTGPWPSSGSTSRGWRRFVCVIGFFFVLIGQWTESKSLHSES